MKRLLHNIFLYYYVSYYKFFKNIKQSDKEASENAKGTFLMNILFIIFILFFRFFWSKLEFLHEGSNFKFLAMIFFVPLVYLFMKKIEIDNLYPNQEKPNLIRGIIVSLTMPLLIFLFFLIGRSL